MDRHFNFLRGVILDWAGTTVDYGCCAPVAAFMEVFRQHAVYVSVPEIRLYMGLAKKDHIRALCRHEAISRRWWKVHGSPPTEATVEALYASFEPQLAKFVARHAVPIDGVVRVVAEMRVRGLKIGATTGFSRDIMQIVAAEAARHGYAPDTWVAPEDVADGRPAPHMIFLNAQRLGIMPYSTLVKIGDTPADIAEGRAAGTWTIGVAGTGNETGLSEENFAALAVDERVIRVRKARARLKGAAAHYVVDALADCLPALYDIECRLAAGGEP
jgi:phosphonoacetaldehyde hydrolase